MNGTKYFTIQVSFSCQNKQLSQVVRKKGHKQRKSDNIIKYTWNYLSFFSENTGLIVYFLSILKKEQATANERINPNGAGRGTLCPHFFLMAVSPKN